jgi:asparagine synthase (glutamine-hydrolysing)
MSEIIHHRGPDDSGYYTDNNVGFGFRRLAILDLSQAGHQPFISPDGRFAIVYNGEIFNYKEFYPELKAAGFKFRSTTDTEVLLYLFMKRGPEMLHSLNGMFAFAIWDAKEKSLFIARDRMGVKPLYYAHSDNSIYFASEPKAIFAAGIKADLNEDCMAELLAFRHIAGENTVFKAVKRLFPGHYVMIRNNSLKMVHWWDLPAKILANREQLPVNPLNWFEETFYSSVNYRTISDVPIGVMLSGGVDSSSIAAALHHNANNNLASFTVTFEDHAYNESHLAKIVARKFDLKYYEVKLRTNDLYERITEASWFNDEPLVHQNDAQLLSLAYFAKANVTVLLSGEGSDELMGGYFRYKPLKHLRLVRNAKVLISLLGKLPNRGVVNRFDKLNRYLNGSNDKSLLLFNAASVFPTDFMALGININTEQFEYRHKVIKEAEGLFPGEIARQAMYYDMFTHINSVLDRNDRMTMGGSIECRVPFLDYRFLEMIPAMPSNLLLKGKKGKWLLLNSIGKKIPPEIRKFKKIGFSIPMQKYMKTDSTLINVLNEINETTFNDIPIFSQLPIASIKRLFNSNLKYGEPILRHLLMLRIWKDSYYSKLSKHNR